jgi:predicted outer membrane protein
MTRFFMPMAIFACLTAMAFGQGAPAVKPQPAAQPGAARAQNAHENAANQLDQHAAACLLIGNQEEIAISEIAMDKANNDRVKDFANQMIKDHQKFIGKLRKFTPQNASFELNLKTDDKGDAKSIDDKKPAAAAARAGETTVAKPAGGHSMMDELLVIKRDKTQECFAMVSDELNQKRGHDFDMAYMGMQCAAHTSMLAELKALKKHTHGEFADLVAEGEKTTKEHLDHAKSIIEDIKHEGRPAARTARDGDRGAGREERIERERPAPPPRDERPLPPRRERP